MSASPLEYTYTSLGVQLVLNNWGCTLFRCKMQYCLNQLFTVHTFAEAWGANVPTMSCLYTLV